MLHQQGDQVDQPGWRLIPLPASERLGSHREGDVPRLAAGASAKPRAAPATCGRRDRPPVLGRSWDDAGIASGRNGTDSRPRDCPAAARGAGADPAVRGGRMDTFFLGLLAIAIGAAFCFAGYRFFRFLMPLWGFAVGFVGGATGVAALFGDGFLATVTSWVVGAVIGLVCALLAYAFYWAAVVLLGASVGYALGAGLILGLGWWGWLAFLVGLSFACTAAIATIALQVPRLLVVVLTALGGASAVLGGLLLWFGAVEVADFNQGMVAAVIRGSWFWLLVALVLAGLGALAQLSSLRTYRLERAAYQY